MASAGAQSASASHTAMCNANGYVLTPTPSAKRQFPSGELLQSKLFLGVSCDAFTQNLGEGAWCWANGGLLTEFNGKTLGLRGYELPECRQHANSYPCACYEVPLPSQRQDAASPAIESSNTVSASQTNTTELDVPVLERGTQNGALTCSAGTVAGPQTAGGEPVAVRTGPGHEFRTLGTLPAGNFVYVFDKRGPWMGIVFGNEDQLEKVECTSKTLRKVPYANTGWVHKDGILAFAQDDG